MKDSNLENFTQELEKAKNILILLPEEPTLDAVASGLSLYLLFKNQEKNVQIGCPTPMRAGFNRLVAIDKISDQIGNRNLIITLDYPKEAIEKVSYNDGDGRFNLVIEPKEEFPTFTKEKINFSYSGVTASLILVVGARSLEDLGSFFEREKKAFEKAVIVNITGEQSQPFGKINFVASQTSSCAEIVYRIIKESGFEINGDIATNLMAGLEEGTGNFTGKVTPETFEAAAFLMRKGAVKGLFTQPVIPSRPMGIPYGPRPAFPFQPVAPQPAPQPSAQPRPQPQKPQPQPSRQPPPDWLQPKIYKGNTMV